MVVIYYILVQTSPAMMVADDDSMVEQKERPPVGTVWRTPAQDSPRCEGSYIAVVSLDAREEGTKLYLYLLETCLEELSTDAFGLLIAVNKTSNRLEVYKDKKWLEEGLKVRQMDQVKVVNKNSLKGAVGHVMYKGRLEDMEGVYFGVKLLKEYKGCGSSDGSFRKTRYFRCDPDCAIFVSLYHIRAYDACRDHQNALIDKLNIQIGDRIVWLSDRGDERGTVRWLGFLHQNPDQKQYTERDITAGVEFDNPIGKGTGRYKNQQLFQARRKHASLVPVLGLIKEVEYGALNIYVSDEEDDETVTDCPPDEVDSSMSSSFFPKEGASLHSSEVQPQPALEVAMIVSVTLAHPCVGIVRYLETQGSRVLVGLEMDQPDPHSYTDGTFSGVRKFVCGPHRAFFVYAHKCRFDVDLASIYGKENSPSVVEDVLPVNQVDALSGHYRGIQGHSGSSYMDAVLLAVFLNHDALYDTVRDVHVYGVAVRVKSHLLDTIVRPLRAHHYVRADRLLQLRVLIQHACSTKYMAVPDLSSPATDPEVLLNCLLGGVLGLGSLVVLTASGVNLEDDRSFVTHLSLNMLPTESISLQGAPSLSDLLVLTMFQANMKFADAPQMLIVKIHRKKPQEPIYLDPCLDITDLVVTSARECVICGILASLECLDCFIENQPSLQNITFCEECFKTSHSRDKSNHSSQKLHTPDGLTSPQRLTMELQAVICRQPDHKYVTYLRFYHQENNSEEWMVFDSQGDKSSHPPHYVPMATPCPDIPTWLLSTARANMWDKCAQDFVPDVSTFLTNSYMCVYTQRK